MSNKPNKKLRFNYYTQVIYKYRMIKYENNTRLK